MLFASLPRLFARRLFFVCAALSASAAVLLAQSPTALDGFDADVDGAVLAVVTQPDGRVVIGGQFTSVRGFPRNNLARLNADGSLDEAFNPGPDAAVRALAVQSDGRIVLGGDFGNLAPGGGAAVARGRLARLNANGTLDTSFALHLVGETLPGATTPLKSQVLALAALPDGSLMVGGSFASVQQGSATFSRRNLLRINAAGSLDLTYEPHPNGMVLAIMPHFDGKVIIGGGFTSLWPAGDRVPSTRNRIARLNANGTVDSEFNPNANNSVFALAVQRDGKVLLGGAFTTLQPLGDTGPANRPHFGRLNPDGTLDSEFHPSVNGNVNALAVQPDGRLLVGGNFQTLSGVTSTGVARPYVARFNSDASLDGTFYPLFNGEVTAFAFQPDGKIIVGGHFTRATPPGGVTAVVRNRLARLNLDGSLDTSFQLDPGGRPLVSVTQANGQVVIGGSFTNVGGVTHNYLARLNADGSVDPSYKPDFNGRVYTMAYEPATNKVIVGGEFTTVGGETRNHIARLNPSGTIDSEFNPNINGRVGVIVVQPDGKILVGGSFTAVQPFGTESTARANLLRLNNNGSLDTAFDPTPNSSVSSLALQSDGKILVGGVFSAFTPGYATNTSATTTSRSYFARLNADGTVDPNFAPTPNGQVSAIAVQADGKIIVGGAFGGFAPPGATELVVRNRIARIAADGTIDTTYDPNANGNVLALALQSDGKLLVGGGFTTFQPNGASGFTVRKYAARLNADGTLDSAFNLDINEQSGNRVDSLRILSNGQILIGGAFSSLQPTGSAARIERRNFARLNANTFVDTAFDPGVTGATGARIDGFAVQPDGKIVAVGSFTDLGGAKTTNIARFRPEGTVDPEFSTALAADGPVNAVAVRPNAGPTLSQAGGLAWLNANGTLRTSFAIDARLAGEINAIAFDREGRLLVAGAFANLSNTTSGNLVRINANGTLDTSFNPAPNGQVTGVAVQSDGRIVIVGSFTNVRDLARNRIARIDDNGSVDVTYDPNANGRINAIALEGDGRAIVGGAFTSFSPNLAETATTRNYLARINVDGTLDTGYDPSANAAVHTLALQADGKAVAGGAFTSVAPNGAVEGSTRNGIARFNADGSLDQNFRPNPNGTVNALVALANGQFYLGGTFTTLQPNETGTVHTRNYLARINSDGAVDTSFDPNPNAAVTTLALQSDGSLLVGGLFGGLQPGATGATLTRNRLARVTATGAVDLGFDPDINGSISTIVARPDGSVLLGGNFTALQLNGAIVVGGSFNTVGGVAARNLAMLNANGSVNATFQPRPDGAVYAVLPQPDGKVLVGGAFSTIAGTARTSLARFNADGTLDTAFAPAAMRWVVRALALQPDGKVLVGGSMGGLLRLNADGSADRSFTAIEDVGPPSPSTGIRGLAVQADGRILVLHPRGLSRLAADGRPDPLGVSITLVPGTHAFTLQADGGILLGSSNAITVEGVARSYLVRLTAAGQLDPSFAPAPNAGVTALAVQADGRVMVGGEFSRIAGQARVALARLAAGGSATQMLGVSANRTTVTWTRGGATGELAAVRFERSTDLLTWTHLGQGVRVGDGASWQLSGLSLPASGTFYIRALGIVPTSAGLSAGVYEMVREFNFAAPGAAGSSSPIRASTVAGGIAFDPFTGIAARSTVLVVPGEGTVEILAAERPLDAAPGASRLVNLSTRGRVTTANPLLLGFAIAGTEPRRVLVRAVGPGLVPLGVPDALPATRLHIYSSTGAVLASAEGWGGVPELPLVAAQTGAFPLVAGSADSAAVLTLEPGAYTMQVADVRGSGGVALAEIYDAGTGTASRLVNVSSRGAAGSGSAALISGFVIAGEAPQRVLLRGVGPGLVRFGTAGTVADPAVALYDGLGVELGGNDNWVSSVPVLSEAARAVGAFPLDAGSKDAAVLATLPAGAYTTQVSAGATGTALLEIYEVR